jgi:hypothetical protein
MTQNYIVIGDRNDAKQVTVSDLDSFTLLELRAFRVRLGALSADLDDSVADSKRRLAENPSDEAAKARLFRARHKKGKVLFFIGEAKAREVLLGVGRAACGKKLSGNQATHLAHQRASKKYEFFKRRSFYALLRETMDSDVLASLEQKAAAAATADLKEWAEAEHLDNSVVTHVLTFK